MSTKADYKEVATEARQRIPQVVRGLMGLTGKRVSDIAEVLGISQPSMSERLNAKAGFRAEEIAILAAFFDVDESYFFADPRYRAVSGDFPSSYRKWNMPMPVQEAFLFDVPETGGTSSPLVPAA